MITFGGIGRRASCQGDDFGAVLFSQFRYANRGFAHSRLGIEAAFTGDDVIGIFNSFCQADGIEDDLDA